MREPTASTPRLTRPKRSHPRAPVSPASAGERHTHHIAVETGPEPVSVTIGGATEIPAGAHAPIPGGFAKFFNRVIDSGAWAALPDAGRAIYMPLVRFADGREGFRVRVGLASLMKHAGLSRSSVKRGLRALQEARLLAVVRAGGVGPDGANRTNVYQLLLPEEAVESTAAPVQSAAKAKRGGKAATQVAKEQQPAEASSLRAAPAPAPATALLGSPGLILSIDSWGDLATAGGSPANPLPVHGQSPRGVDAEPPAEPAAVPRGDPDANPAAGPVVDGTGPIAGPLLRDTSSDLHSEHAAAEQVEGVEMSSDHEARATAELLTRWGVAPAIARQLAAEHPRAAVMGAIELARQARARGRLRNPAGFLVRCLEESWGDPIDAPPPARASDHQAQQHAQRTEAAEVEAQRAAVDAQIDALDDATLARLVEHVLARHADRPAMLRLLQARPPRQSRLMCAEISALLDAETPPPG